MSSSSSSQYLHSNPLAEHNSGIALSSKEIPVGGTGNMYMGQGGRAFVQGGGGMSQFHSFAGGDGNNAYAHGSYAPVTVGYNSVTRGGAKKRRSKVKSRKTTAHSKKKSHKKCAYCRNKRMSRRRRASGRRIRYSQNGGGWGAPYGSSAASGINAAYSVGGAGTEVTRDTIALANPAPHTPYNACHPVA
jgi:hypothetical protein